MLDHARRDALDGCGPAHELTIAIRGALAACLVDAGCPAQARVEFDRAARDAAAALGRDHVDAIALRAARDALPTPPTRPPPTRMRRATRRRGRG